MGNLFIVNAILENMENVRRIKNWMKFSRKLGWCAVPGFWANFKHKIGIHCEI